MSAGNKNCLEIGKISNEEEFLGFPHNLWLTEAVEGAPWSSSIPGCWFRKQQCEISYHIWSRGNFWDHSQVSAEISMLLPALTAAKSQGQMILDQPVSILPRKPLHHHNPHHSIPGWASLGRTTLGSSAPTSLLHLGHPRALGCVQMVLEGLQRWRLHHKLGPPQAAACGHLWMPLEELDMEIS